jgi:peptidase M23-like protein
MGRFLFVIHIIFLVLAAILIGGSIGGFLGSGYMIAAALLVIVLWGVYAGLTINAIRLANAVANGTGDLTTALRWASRLFLIVTILSAVTGFAFAFLSFVGCGPLWIPCLYQWAGLIGTILGFLTFLLLPVIVRAFGEGNNDYATYDRSYWLVSVPLLLVVLWGLAWLIGYSWLNGDINEKEYSGADHVYKLPFPEGESTWVIQGNNSSFNHNDDNPQKPQKFSWDFRRRCGTPVLAARDGVVLEVDDTHDEMGSDKPNNKIRIRHADDTVATYFHIEKGSIPKGFRTLGAKVRQGNEIAKVGSVGNSLTGHIHFMVKKWDPKTNKEGNTIAVSFIDEDVKDDKGIPRTFSSYTSGNRVVP